MTLIDDTLPRTDGGEPLAAPNLLGISDGDGTAATGGSATGGSAGPGAAGSAPGAVSAREPTAGEPLEVPAAGRSLFVTLLSAGAVALTTGGIFGSWGARLLGVVAVAIGVGWSALAVRQPERRNFYIAGALPLAILLAAASLLVGGGNTTGGPIHVIQQAVQAGRLLRPPVPFDPGWRPLLVVIFLMLGFSASWIGGSRERPQLSLLIPLPLLLVAAISQPSNQQLLAGILAFVPLVAALAVLFGGDGRSTANLSGAFELRRAAKGAALMIPVVLALVLVSQTSFLFPKPSYNPQSQPQKPRAVPLSDLTNADLFDVHGSITGPWKTGDLDVYQGGNWLLPPYLNKNLAKVPSDGNVLPVPTGGTTSVTFTIKDIGTTSVLPGLVGATSISVPHRSGVIYDSRDGTFRETSGRVPTSLVYTVTIPTYPSVADLTDAPPLPADFDKTYLSVPSPPPAVRDLLLQAPNDPWLRLSFLLSKQYAVEIAAGSGGPVAVTPATVQRILAGDHKGTPFELVASQALLARWAGVPARIGFGFDGFDQNGAEQAVRPDDAAQWVEVYFAGRGWVPLVTTPPRAQATLNTQHAKFNPLVQPDADVAVSIYVPVKIKSLTALYQQVRAVLLGLLPFILLALAAYLGEPAFLRWVRRLRRRRWAADHSPEAAVLVEYCELRDFAADLGIGDPCATPLEYLDFVAEDDEHQELAWLVSRALYGDMAGRAGANDIEAAREMSRSLRKRMAAAQPFQSRVLAVLARTSLREPYNREVPDHPLHFLSRLPRPRWGLLLRGRRIRRPRLPFFTGARI